MGFRLFVPSGEGQYRIVPRRPECLGANATLQWAVLGSTAAAAAYTSIATRYDHGASAGHVLPRTALFLRSSAKLALCAGAVGAAANWYYDSRFKSVVLSDTSGEVKPWTLYERTRELTVDDGCLVGAGLGLAASVPALLMRRLAAPRWTRCLGLANIGACAGILGAHAHLHFTGERQKAYRSLERRLQRRSLEFWRLFWAKQSMSSFNPLVQLYIRHNALWYAQQLPSSAFEHADGLDPDSSDLPDSNTATNGPDSTPTHQDQPYYVPPFDYAEDLKYISVEATRAKIEEHEAEIAALLKEAEFILFVSAHRQYEYCHLHESDDERRRQRLEELQLLQITYNKLRSAAEILQSRLINWRMSLQHKAIVDSPESATGSVDAWLPQSTHSFEVHNPELSIQELERTQAALDAEIRSFEASIAHPGYTKGEKDRWRMDLEDGRSLQRVADKIVWEFEKMQGTACNKPTSEPVASAQVDATAATKPTGGNLEVDKS
ncbi:uncharacterized protein M421DRAFT_416532 [Didymella exigua CBS 183.55]|uniref:Uncharacterized protein n=1 Tax=Didymella exigua CBS 183.55 TaxID=1150837 RepID=A0A6A5RWQ7_9PLEO|nr:uncharacterized protein M421DRAFT_416532 [Didymella exigua CBS 183.55]KAF1932935.1 hypothetical protein M421DRAFT_416532 [Didymella exigua CBS 183.55]